MIENRQHNRIIMNLPITECSDLGAAEGLITNMSKTGLCYYRFPSSTPNTSKTIDLSFCPFCCERQITVTSSVVHRQIIGKYSLIGVQFLQPNEETQELIDKQISRFPVSTL